MIIISHRGYWESTDEKNTLKAFQNSILTGFGTETDVRDFNSQLVVSHDIANEKSLGINHLLELFSENNYLLALNVKADGLQKLLYEAIISNNISNYFVFDMSIPDTIGYLNMGFNVFGRQSEFEREVAFYSKIRGIWLDCFNEIWYDLDLIKSHLNNGKQVCIVSADLHKRSHLDHWAFLKSTELYKSENLILCTDFPNEAKLFFNRK